MAEVSKGPSVKLWELPDVLLFTVVAFCAAPTHRATVVCHQIATLCQAARLAVLEEESSMTLWNTILKEDYGGHDRSGKSLEKKCRACKRLRRTPVALVRDAHRLIQDNTEIAFFYLAEMVNASSKKEALSIRKLHGLLNEYGPVLRINKVMSAGGLYLVEVCRARHVKEAVVLKCVQELIEMRGAMVDLQTNESAQSRQTALCVAAARAMPTVVRYLLKRGAATDTPCTGRFRLHTAVKKTARCTNATPLDFAQAMLQAEQEAGASKESLSDLKKCIRMLEKNC
jgi:hypothetical protein